MLRFNKVHAYKNQNVILIRSILLIGVVLASIQFLYNRSIWIDEASLAINIISRNYFELLKPLDNYQSAPILFLLIEKYFSEIIPFSEYGLRIFPLICYFISLYFFYKTIKCIFNNFLTVIFALSLFVFNSTLIYYSSEVKQYMCDVLVTTIIFYVTIKNYKKDRSKYLLLAFVGSISIFISNITPILLLTVGIYMLYDFYPLAKNNYTSLLGISLSWGISFFVYYYFFIHNHPARLPMINMHQEFFMPLNPFGKSFYKFVILIGPMITCGLFRFTILGGIIISVISFKGFIQFIKDRNFKIFILAFIPIFIHFLLSGLKIYPVQKRMILYLSICIIIICSNGFYSIIKSQIIIHKINFLRKFAFYIPFTFLGLMSAYLVKVGFPIVVHSDIKNCILYIEKNMHKNDKVQVINWDATIPFTYYMNISFSKINPDNITLDPLFCSDEISCEEKLHLLKGRVWFIFGPDNNEAKKKAILKAYESKGKKAIHQFQAINTDVFLFYN